LWRRLLATERDVTAGHGLSMWGYAALHELAATPVRSQAVLADGLGLDRTRVIPVLDDLQERGLIRREPDPEDRRVRVLTITTDGRRLFRKVQRDVHRAEDELLGLLGAEDRAAFVRSAAVLGRAAAGPER